MKASGRSGYVLTCKLMPVPVLSTELSICVDYFVKKSSLPDKSLS